VGAGWTRLLVRVDATAMLSRRRSRLLRLSASVICCELRLLIKSEQFLPNKCRVSSEST
jgi:hypothetical protein